MRPLVVVPPFSQGTVTLREGGKAEGNTVQYRPRRMFCNVHFVIGSIDRRLSFTVKLYLLFVPPTCLSHQRGRKKRKKKKKKNVSS
jgi:hypothetical protein